MIFDINESLSAEECSKQAQFNLDQMKRLDSEISSLRRTLHSIPCYDCPEPEDRELVNALSNKIERLSDCADNYERQVDYWQTQNIMRFYGRRKIENTTLRFTKIQGTSESAQIRTSVELYHTAGSMPS